MGACEKTFGGLNTSKGLLSLEEKTPGAASGTLRQLCMNWLKHSFNIEAEIRNTEVKKLKAIDYILNIVPVKFDFVTYNGEEGDGIAFLDQNDVLQAIIRGP